MFHAKQTRGHSMAIGYRDLKWRGDSLYLRDSRRVLCRLIRDTPTGLWRVEHPGGLTDILNLSRAVSAAMGIAFDLLTAERVPGEAVH
jgi:hypothetical protein